MAIGVGIDVGTVSVKMALFSAREEDAPVLERLSARAGFPPVRVVGLHEGRPGWLAVAPYARIAGNPRSQAREVLERVFDHADRGAVGAIVGTGRGAAVLETEMGLGRANEFRVLTRAAELLLPGVHTLFEIGGEVSRYVRFERHGTDGRLGIADYRTNGDCAAGTGSFLDQQAGRLRFRVEDLGRIALATKRAAQIAGRCSVFAKSDMIHAQQRGFTPEEILNGLCDAVARNFRSSITKGRSITPEVALVGGVANNAGVVRSLEQAFEWEPGRLVVPPEPAAFSAIGAACLAHERNGTGSPRSRPWVPDGTPVEAPPFPTAPPLSMERVLLLRDRLRAVPLPAGDEPVDAYLGIDIGSVSTNLVVIDPAGQVLKEIYLRTDARPVEAVGRGLRDIEETLGRRIRIRGVGTTGSGRELIAELVGADTTRDEITAHKTGAAFIDRSLLGLGVDTIFEIGGQDAKYISLEDGIVVDFTMNEACAAGTGSFLEERAQELGVRIEEEFAALALSSRTPIRLGERCTVFMEKDVNDCLRRGAALEDIVAGLAYSVATNYVNRVVRGRRIGETIFLQGGTAYNDAVAAALAAVVGKRVVVPPFNGVMGALGVALLARDRMAKAGADSLFRGYAPHEVDCETFEFTCRGCTNYCQMQRVTVEGRHTYWGDKCSVRYRKAARGDREAVIEDLVAFRRSRLLEGYAPEAGRGPVVGLPLCLSTYDWAPFWFAAFRALDVRVLLSEPTRNDVVKLGVESTVSEPCFPVVVSHGHVRALLDKAVDFVFLPNNIAAPGDPERRPCFFCPWHQTLPFVTRSAPSIFERREKLITPTLWYNLGERPVAASLRQAFDAAGLHWPARRVDEAVRRGFEALAAFRASLIEAGRKALRTLETTGEPGVVLLGRPYNIYDGGTNLEIATKLREYYGTNVVPFDFLDLEPADIARYEADFYWSYGTRILASAAFARTRPNLHLIYLTNFNCGPDSYVKHYVAEASGRPFLALQVDGHNNDAGLLTRCEAYLDSKGVLR
jgi:predicted CoA-substrate-specific enzyme activase